MTGATLPPWTAGNGRERQMMHDRVNARLNEENQAEAERRIGDADLDAPCRPPVIAPEHAEKYNKWRREGGLERAAAEHGVIELARRRVRSVFPLLADLVQLPPLKRGKNIIPPDPATGFISLARRRTWNGFECFGKLTITGETAARLTARAQLRSPLSVMKSQLKKSCRA